MILGIGIDLVSVERIEDLENKFGGQFREKFLSRIFTKNEAEFAEKKSARTIFLATRFAAKEAFAKALGLGIGRGINFLDLEIENDELGKPKIKILNGKSDFVKKHFAVEDFVAHLSLTDEKKFASAMVVIEKKI
ncbi:MAG: holo-ACP synthase [Alphaproteobacteria bacterium]|nr:holo-ACP synthase [Alphaproteobacteria bacterium]